MDKIITIKKIRNSSIIDNENAINFLREYEQSVPTREEFILPLVINLKCRLLSEIIFGKIVHSPYIDILTFRPFEVKECKRFEKKYPETKNFINDYVLGNKQKRIFEQIVNEKIGFCHFVIDKYIEKDLYT